MRVFHLFSGAGGGCLANLILGQIPVAALDYEESRVRILRNRILDGWLPIDLETICGDADEYDYTKWEGKVDCLWAGIPCPRWSTARHGRGNTYDGRPAFLRAVREMYPEWLFWECVPGFKKEHRSLSDLLKECGYEVADPIILAAASVGAPHLRKRYWCLARHPDKGKESALSKHEKASRLQTSAGSFWDSDPRDIRMVNGVACKMDRLESVGDGQVPLCAAAAWLLLGGPFAG